MSPQPLSPLYACSWHFFSDLHTNPLNESGRFVSGFRCLSTNEENRSEEPKPSTLWRWLDQAVKRGLVACEGKGSKSDPFLYWLPEVEAVWKEDPIYVAVEAQKVALKLPFQSLTERKKILGETPCPPGRAVGAEWSDDGEDL
jgi:hypothetical protein